MITLKYIREQINVIRAHDPAIHSDWEVFLYPSFWAVYYYRKAHEHYLKGHYFRARRISQKAARKTGIEIHPGAKIGKNFFIDHGTGVIIGETAEIGDNVLIYQGVTLGGTGKEKGKRHPTIGDNVMISAGAKVLGSFKIGNNVKIGAGSVVLESVPDNCTVVGVPGRVVKRWNAELPSEIIDQTDLPDPVREDLDSLKSANAELTNHILSLEEELHAMKNEASGSTEKHRVEMDKANTEGMNGDGI
ncbi:MAG: serine O-acetyltransferase [Lachnospiraceae bacterium]|nr:serine O-acetyltransferase [Lachnospiraceae bacterium]